MLFSFFLLTFFIHVSYSLISRVSNLAENPADFYFWIYEYDEDTAHEY